MGKKAAAAIGRALLLSTCSSSKVTGNDALSSSSYALITSCFPSWFPDVLRKWRSFFNCLPCSFFFFSCARLKGSWTLFENHPPLYFIYKEESDAACFVMFQSSGFWSRKNFKIPLSIMLRYTLVRIYIDLYHAATDLVLVAVTVFFPFFFYFYYSFHLQKRFFSFYLSAYFFFLPLFR